VLRAIMGSLRRHKALAMTVYESEMDAYQCQLQQQPALGCRNSHAAGLLALPRQ